MLQPSKHAHPDRTVIAAAAVLLQHLMSRRVETLDQLRQHLERSRCGGTALFLPAVNLLYLLGLVDYRPKTDAFEYTGC